MPMRVPIQQIRSGLILSEDVKDPVGRLLVSAGATLTDRHIEILRKWGVQSVEVVSEESEEAQITEDLLKQAAEELRAKFLHFETVFPAAEEIYHIAVEKKALKLKRASFQDQRG